MTGQPYTTGLDLAAIANLEPRTPLCTTCQGRHPHGGLSTCMASVLARMRLLSYGKTTAYNSSGTSQTEHARPSGDAHPMHEQWRAAYNNAAADTGRRWAIDKALEALNRELRQHKHVPVADLEQTRQDRIAEATEGWRDTDVATAHALTLPQVHRMRAKRDQDPLTGEPAAEETQATPEAIERARELRAKGMSFRQIQMSTGVSKSALHRHLKAA